jgi:hypothetical protein
MSRVAERTSHCAANCGRLIRCGEPYEMVVGSGDRPTAYVHPGCLDAYERLLAAGQTPNAPQSEEAESEIIEGTCERCGHALSARRSRGGLPARCPVPAHVLPDRVAPIGPGGTCGGRLLDPDVALMAWKPARAAGGQGAAGKRSPAGIGEPARSRSEGRLRKLEPGGVLGGELGERAGQLSARGGAQPEPTPEEGGT